MAGEYASTPILMNSDSTEKFFYSLHASCFVQKGEHFLAQTIIQVNHSGSTLPTEQAVKARNANNTLNSSIAEYHGLIGTAMFIPFKQKITAPAPCVSYVVETGHNTDNTAFYRKYSDGYIEQWGNVAGISQTIN